MARTIALNLLLKVSGSKTMSQAEKKIGQLRDRLASFSDVANRVGIGAGVAFGAGLAQALDVSKGRAKLSAQLGLTEKESRRVGDVAGKVFAGAYGESMEQVNAAVASVVQNISGMRTASSSALQDTTQRALTLATVMDEDVGRVTAAVSTLMKTGLSKDAKEAFDVILRGAQLGANKQQDLLDTLTEYPTLFRNMGLSAQEATGLLVQGLNAGARDSDKVADAIKEFSIRAVDGSNLTADGFEMIGLNAGIMADRIGKGGRSAREALDLTLDRLRAMKDPVKQSQAAVALFGTQAEDLGKALYALDLDTAASGMGKVAGAVDTASKTMGETAAARIERLKRSFLTTFVDVVGGTVLPKIESFVGWLGKLGVTPKGLIILAGVFVGLAVGVKTAQLALTLYSGALKAVQFGSKIAAAATWLFNTALRANPIGIVITALVALGAALVVLYNKSSTFRSIVQAAFQGVAAVGLWLWKNALKPAFEGIGKIATWLWKNVISPYFEAIGFIFSNVVAPVAIWLWKNVFQPAFKGIGFVAEVLWGIIQVNFMAAVYLWKKTVAPVVTWLWKNIIQPAFKGVGLIIKSVWDGVIKPVFNALKAAIKLVADSFKSSVTNIGKWWDKLRDAARKPVKWVVDTVYTGGIKRVYDAIATKVGASPLPAAPRFAEGGKIRGPGGSRSDKVPIWGSNGEYIVNAKSTRRYLPLLERINREGGRDASVGRALGLMGDPGGLGIPGYANGGLVAGIGRFLAQAKDFFSAGAVKAARWVTDPLLSLGDRVIGGTSFGKMLMGLVRKAVDGVLGWIRGKEGQLGSGNKAVAAARSQIGVPYSWGGGGPHGPSYGIAQGAGIRGFDCSALMQYAWYQATGKVIPRTTYTQMPWVKRISQPRPGALGFPHSGHVFMYSGNGKIIEAPYTGASVRETAARRAMFWGMPPFATADSGAAVLRPGMNHIYNGTGGMEPLVDPRMMGGNTYHIEVNVAPGGDLVQAGAQVVRAIKAYENRNGARWRK